MVAGGRKEKSVIDPLYSFLIVYIGFNNKALKEGYDKRRNNFIAKQPACRVSLKNVSSDWVTSLAYAGNTVDIIVFTESMT